MIASIFFIALPHLPGRKTRLALPSVVSNEIARQPKHALCQFSRREFCGLIQRPTVMWLILSGGDATTTAQTLSHLHKKQAHLRGTLSRIGAFALQEAGNHQ
jgi:hypothetical protein